MLNYFTSFYKCKEDDAEEGQENQLKEPDFSTIRAYVQETTAEPEDILYGLLTAIIEQKQEMI